MCSRNEASGRCCLVRIPGQEFNRTFVFAQLEPVGAPALDRIPGGHWQDSMTERCAFARKRLGQALDAAGGIGSPGGCALWHMAGLGRSVREWSALDDEVSAYAQWFDGLTPDVAAKVATAKYRMQQGNLSSIEWFRGIGEYKINFGAGWPIYLAKDGVEIIMLLGGGSKSGQQRDIDRAVALWEEYKRRKATALKQSKAIVVKGKRKG